jgi:hypothetical protein
LRKEVIHLLRKLAVLLALVVLALCTVQAALAAPNHHPGNSPNGSAWGGSGLVDGR